MAKKKSNTKWIIGGVVIGGAILFMSMLSIGQNTVYFYTPSEAVAQAADLQRNDIRIGGMVQAGTVDWQPKELRLAFTLTDFKGHNINVVHHGTAPDMFKEGQGVVVEGMIGSEGKSMKSKKLLVKHSEEYKMPEEMGSINKKLLEDSILNK